MTRPDNAEGNPGIGPFPAPRGVGFRFRRSLTDEELERIRSAAKRPGRNGGLDAAFRATWDILLGEAEGMTMAQAVDRGLKFHPLEYALPEHQAQQVLSIWVRHRGPRYRIASAASLLWMSMGPASVPSWSPTLPSKLNRNPE